MNSSKFFRIFFGILMLFGGFYCLFTPGLTYLAIGWIVGFSILFDAIANLFTWNAKRKAGLADGWSLAGAILSCVFGILILSSAALQLAIDAVLLYFVAFWLIARGVIRMVASVELQRAQKAAPESSFSKKWGWVMVSGILLVLLGILAFFNPLVLAFTVGIMVGWCIIFAGFNLLFTE